VKSTKDTSHAFIVRVWMEPRDIKDSEPTWRGVIEHVGSGARVYFDQLEQIVGHLLPYVEAMGVKVDKPKA
jgi:hypothetical protein